MTPFKICGLRDVDSALVAADCGASLLGFVFVPGVRRRLALPQGRAIIRRVADELGDDCPGLVGLFADQDADEVNHIVAECGLQYAQLCGSEAPDYWDGIGAEVIKQVRVKPLATEQATFEDARDRVERISSLGRRAQLDSYAQGALGGTGHAFDWNIAARIARERDVALSGGLTSQNVASAIRQVSPWMVDVSSGVETDGAKDAAKIRGFADAVRSASAESAG